MVSRGARGISPAARGDSLAKTIAAVAAKAGRGFAAAGSRGATGGGGGSDRAVAVGRGGDEAREGRARNGGATTPRDRRVCHRHGQKPFASGKGAGACAFV